MGTVNDRPHPFVMRLVGIAQDALERDVERLIERPYCEDTFARLCKRVDEFAGYLYGHLGIKVYASVWHKLDDDAVGGLLSVTVGNGDEQVGAILSLITHGWEDEWPINDKLPGRIA